MRVPAFDGEDSLDQVAGSGPRCRRFVMGLADAEPGEAILHLGRPGRDGASAALVPLDVGQVRGVIGEALVVDGDGRFRGGRFLQAGVLPGLLNAFLQKLGVDGTVIHVAEGDPMTGQRPVKLDDPADEVGAGLLPEGLLAGPEELVEQRGDAVGQRVGIHVRREGVPLPAAAEPDLQVVAPASRLVEDLPDLVAEVAFDFKHQAGRAFRLVVRLPAEQLPGEGMHAGRRLAGADRAEDGEPGVEPPLVEGEPLGPVNLSRLCGVMQFPNDEAGLVGVIVGPRRKYAARSAEATRLGDPYTPGAGDCENGVGGRQAGDHQEPGVERDVGGGGSVAATRSRMTVGAWVGPGPKPRIGDRRGRGQRGARSRRAR